MKKILLLTLISLLLVVPDALPQRKSKRKSPVKSSIPLATDAETRKAGYKKRQQLMRESLVANIPFRSIVPTVMSGRVVDLAVDPQDPAHFYVAFASGGLWETKNEGASYKPLFDREMVMTIGDIAVDWKNEVIYLGSGESNSSRSSYAGFGVYKSADNGKTWTHLGLSDSHHIGRVVIHPKDPDVIWVAALGHLYSPNEERGIFKSTDAGKTWKKTLFIDNQTGFTELIIDPSNPDRLLAAAWQKDRKAWNFDGAGKGSGIYRSEDGGETWTKSQQGIPATIGVGRIGLAMSQSSPNIVYAIHDNQDRKPATDKKEAGVLTKETLRNISNDRFLNLSNKEINDFLDDNGFPARYNAPDIKEMVRKGSLQPSSLVEYLEDANSLLFDTPVKGAEIFRSEDGGKSWKKTHGGNIEDLVYSYGYYFGQIRVDAQNPDKLYTFGVPVITSDDGGKTWRSIDGSNVHSDHHALWINPNKSGHLILGNDGGINISYDDGETWIHTNSLPVGQFYSVNYDMAKPYNVYGGLQDNGVWKGPSTYSYSDGWYSNGQYPYKRIMGGDGMQVEIDSRDNETVYTGFQFGNYFRLNTRTGERKPITPKHELGERPLRWNWQSPIQISKHNQDIIYFGSNKFHRSFDKGDNFESSEQDLTKGGRKGNVSYGTLTTIDESPLRFGMIYTGSDDGLVHLSVDGGYTFKNISSGLPANFWISRVDASAFSEDRVYISLNGYRWDSFDALVYMSNDRGTTWKRIGTNLPAEPVNVIKEDPANEDVLYVGTDHGVYVSLDRGTTFMAMGKELPAVPVHDLVIHPRENELILGTHGRSLYVADVSPLQQMNPEKMNAALFIHSVDDQVYSNGWGKKSYTWGDIREPAGKIIMFAGTAGQYRIEVMNAEGKVVREMTTEADRGINIVAYNYTADQGDEASKAENGKYYLKPGTYKLKITGNGSSAEQEFKISEPREKPERKGSK